MSPINIPIKPPPRVNIANGVNGGGDGTGEREERKKKERLPTVWEEARIYTREEKRDERGKRKREREREKERSCEKSNPLFRGVIIVIIYYSSPWRAARLCIAAECHSGGSHGKARGVAARRLPHLERAPNRSGPTSRVSLFLSFVSVLVISGRKTKRLTRRRDLDG